MVKKVYKHISKAGHSLAARAELGLGNGEVITTQTLEDIILVGGLTKKMNVLLGSLIAEEELWTEAMDLAMSDRDQLAFRASWALEWAYSSNMERFAEFIPRFFGDYLKAMNHSVNRVYSKMLCDMIRRRAITLTDGEAEQVAVKCFDLLVNPETAVAIKVWQIELLSDLRSRFDWIEEELTAVVRAMSENPGCTPAEAAHARHYFKRLASEKGRPKKI